MKYNNETSCNCFKWGREEVKGRELTNVQCKPILNCHNECPLYNEYILIKMKNEYIFIKMKNAKPKK
jgi:hypothetical protein